MTDICDRAGILADEYFHGELLPEDEKMIEGHIENCEKCASVFNNWRKYFEEVKLAEYTPEIDIAESVMDKIITGRIAVDKPAKRRFVPFGLIGAAAVVLVMLITSNVDFFNIYNYNFRYDNIVPRNANGAGGTEIAPGAAETAETEAADDTHMPRGFHVPSPQMAPVLQDAADGAARQDWDFWAEAELPVVAAAGAPMPPAAAQVAAPPHGDGALVPGEIIRIRQNADFRIPAHIIATETGFFITRDQRDIFIEDLQRHDIFYEIESTGIYSHYIEIIYMD